LDGFDGCWLTGADGAKFVFASGDAGAAAVNFEPAGFDEDATFGFEDVRYRRDACAPFFVSPSKALALARPAHFKSCAMVRGGAWAQALRISLLSMASAESMERMRF